jgi:hypothetical protein
MVDETRSRRSQHIGVDSQDRALVKDNSGKTELRSRREPLAVLDRQPGRQQDCGAVRRQEFDHAMRLGKGGTTIGEHIGKELRDLYEDVVAQPVPDRFLELLNQLEAGSIYGKDSS